MKFKWTSSRIVFIKFIVSLFIIGIIFGFIFYSNESNLIKTNIINEITNLKEYLILTRQNNFLYHIILLSVLTVLSLLVIGLPIILFYFFYEGVSFGYLLAALFHINGIDGLFFGIIFSLINKLFIYLALIYLIYTSYHYSKSVIISARNKNYQISSYISKHLFRIILIFLFVILFDVFIYFLGNKIVGYFIFLL